MAIGESWSILYYVVNILSLILPKIHNNSRYAYVSRSQTDTNNHVFFKNYAKKHSIISKVFVLFKIVLSKSSTKLYIYHQSNSFLKINADLCNFTCIYTCIYCVLYFPLNIIHFHVWTEYFLSIISCTVLYMIPDLNFIYLSF